MSGAFLDLAEELETAKSDDLIAVPAWKLRLLAATPVVTDEMVGLTARNAALDEAAKVANDAGEAFRTRHQTAYAEGFTDACDAIYIACRALKVKDTTNV